MEDFKWENSPKTQYEPSKQQNLQGVVPNASVIPNEYGGIYDKPKKSKTGFLQSRLNKDNFWNVMFFVITTLFMFLPNIIVNFVPILGLVTLILGITFIPYKVARINSVIYKDNKFFSSNERDLSSNLPQFALWILVLSFIFTIFLVFKLHNKWSFLDENFAIYNAIFWFIPTTYFILKNCPISIMFHKEAWTPSVLGVERANLSDNHMQHSANNAFSHGNIINRAHNHSNMSSPRNLYYNPSYRSYSGNVWNNK